MYLFITYSNVSTQKEAGEIYFLLLKILLNWILFCLQVRFGNILCLAVWPVAEIMWVYWKSTSRVTCVMQYMTYQSSECSHRTSGEIIGVPLLTGYCIGGYKFANCGCRPSSYNLPQRK